MKKKTYIVKGSADIKCSRFGTHYIEENWHGTGQKYSIYLNNEDNPDEISMQISGIHPYDDAEYAFARVESFRPNVAQIIKNGSFLSSVKMQPYNEEDWEDVNEYVNDFIDRVIAELERVNEDVEPKIMHF